MGMGAFGVPPGYRAYGDPFSGQLTAPSLGTPRSNFFGSFQSLFPEASYRQLPPSCAVSRNCAAPPVPSDDGHGRRHDSHTLGPSRGHGSHPPRYDDDARYGQSYGRPAKTARTEAEVSARHRHVEPERHGIELRRQPMQHDVLSGHSRAEERPRSDSLEDEERRFHRQRTMQDEGSHHQPPAHARPQVQEVVHWAVCDICRRRRRALKATSGASQRKSWYCSFGFTVGHENLVRKLCSEPQEAGARAPAAREGVRRLDDSREPEPTITHKREPAQPIAPPHAPNDMQRTTRTEHRPPPARDRPLALPAKSAPPCFQFREHGRCTRGAACPYLHAAPTAASCPPPNHGPRTPSIEETLLEAVSLYKLRSLRTRISSEPE